MIKQLAQWKPEKAGKTTGGGGTPVTSASGKRNPERVERFLMLCRAFSTQMLRCLLYGGFTPAYVLIRLSAFILPRLSSFTHPKNVPTSISLPLKINN